MPATDETLSPDGLRRGLKELRLADWAASEAAAGTVIVGPREYMAAMEIGVPGQKVATATSLDDPAVETARRVLVLDPDDEPAAVERARAELGADRVHGFVSGLALARTLGLAMPEDLDETSIRPLPETRYAVVCTARSGSTWFCHLLQNTGILARPTEHLRPPVIFMVRHRRRFGIGLARWADLLMRVRQEDGIFGTKIVDDFVDDLAPHVEADDIEGLKDLSLSSRFIHFERRDKVAQAVSKYMAMKTSIWHLRDNDAVDGYRMEKESVAYDGPELKRIHDELVRNEERLRNALKPYGNRVLHLTYEDATHDPAASVSMACRHVLGHIPEGLEIVHERYFRMADAVNAEMAARFRADYPA